MTSFHLRLGQARADQAPPPREQREPGAGKQARPPAPSLPRPVPPSRGSQYLRGEAPPCGAAPAAPGRTAASWNDRSARRRPARQGRCSRASSPPEPGFRLRRCHGASFLLAPSQGPLQETQLHAQRRSRLALRRPHPFRPASQPPGPPGARPPTAREGTRPPQPASALADPHGPRRRSGWRCAHRRHPDSRASRLWVPDAGPSPRPHTPSQPSAGPGELRLFPRAEPPLFPPAEAGPHACRPLGPVPATEPVRSASAQPRPAQLGPRPCGVCRAFQRRQCLKLRQCPLLPPTLQLSRGAVNLTI